MFALAAIPGSLLIARFGVLARRHFGLGDRDARRPPARAAAVDIWTLYAATLLMGFGVAIFQPALPTLVRLWTPDRVWLANAVSTNGMLVGVTFASALTHSGGAAAGRRQAGGCDLLVWSVPGLVATLLFIVVAPRPRGSRTMRSARRADGGRTGTARSSGCSVSRSAPTTRCFSRPTPSFRTT